MYRKAALILLLGLTACSNHYIEPSLSDTKFAYLEVQQSSITPEGSPSATDLYINYKKVKSQYPIRIKAGRQELKLDVTAYIGSFAKFKSFVAIVNFEKNNSYAIQIKILKPLGLKIDSDANLNATINIVNTTQGEDIGEYEVVLQNKLEDYHYQHNNEVMDAIIQSTIQGIILTQ